MESGARPATGIQERDTGHYHDELRSDSIDAGYKAGLSIRLESGSLLQNDRSYAVFLTLKSNKLTLPGTSLRHGFMGLPKTG
jgi:hypothetical protein